LEPLGLNIFRVTRKFTDRTTDSQTKSLICEHRISSLPTLSMRDATHNIVIVVIGGSQPRRRWIWSARDIKVEEFRTTIRDLLIGARLIRSLIDTG
jgi:hypothetical protein